MSIISGRLFGYIGKRDEKIAALRKGIELGINLVDTAEVYQTEPLVADAVKGHKRDEVFIATTILFTNLSHEKVLKPPKGAYGDSTPPTSIFTRSISPAPSCPSRRQ